MPLALQLEAALEAVFGPDPGRLRLIAALRALVAAAATLGLLLGLLGASDKGAIAAIALGFMCSALAGRLVPDDGARATLLALARLYPAAVGCASAAVLLARWPTVADAGLVLVSAAAILSRLFGPSGLSIGMVGFICFFIGMVIRPPVGALAEMAGGAAAGFLCAGLVHILLLPARPGRALERILRDFDRRILRIIRDLRRARAAPAPSEGQRHRLHRELARFSDGALVALDQLERLRPVQGQRGMDLAQALLSLEIAVERLARTALAAAPGDEGLADRQRQRSRGAPQALLHARSNLRRVAKTAQDDGSTPKAPASTETAQGLDLSLRNPILRQAIQTLVATSLAVGVGSLLSERRSYWAVIAAFVIQSGVASRGEALIKALQRLAGTAAGVLAGMVLATAISGHSILALALILCCIFLAYYAFQQAYAIMIFGITLMLALLYGLIGQFTPGLLVLRLEETAVGAAAACGAALLVLPQRQHDAFRAATQDFLAALRRVVEASLDRRDPGQADLVVAMRSKAQAMRQALAPLKRGWIFLLRDAHRDLVRSAMRCDYLARELWARRDLAPADVASILRRIEGLQSEIGTAPARACDDESGPRVESPEARELLRELARLRVGLRGMR